MAKSHMWQWQQVGTAEQRRGGPTGSRSWSRGWTVGYLWWWWFCFWCGQTCGWTGTQQQRYQVFGDEADVREVRTGRQWGVGGGRWRLPDFWVDAPFVVSTSFIPLLKALGGTLSEKGGPFLRLLLCGHFPFCSSPTPDKECAPALAALHYLHTPFLFR